MKQIAAALALGLALALTGTANAESNDEGLSVLIRDSARSVNTRGVIVRNVSAPRDAAVRSSSLSNTSRSLSVRDVDVQRVASTTSRFMTKPLAPVMDDSQPAIVIPAPIRAGTIPEDPPPKENRSRKPSASKDSGKKKRSLMDKWFRRS